MHIIVPDKVKKAVLPGLFALYIIATIIAFLLHARYFNQILAKTFAIPSSPSQVTVDLATLNRVAAVISLNQNNIDALTSSAANLIATSTAPEIQTPTVIPPVLIAPTTTPATTTNVGTAQPVKPRVATSSPASTSSTVNKKTSASTTTAPLRRP